MRHKVQPQRAHNYSQSPQRFSLAHRGRGQSTLEYFIIFAVIACVFIPLWAGKTFSKVKDSGNEFFTACVNRIVVDNNSDPGEPGLGTGPADVTLGSNFPNPFSEYTRFAIVIKDNPCHIKIKIYNTQNRLIDTIDCGIMAVGTYGGEGNAGVKPAPYWYPDSNLSSGIYVWYAEIPGAEYNNNGRKMNLVK